MSKHTPGPWGYEKCHTPFLGEKAVNLLGDGKILAQYIVFADAENFIDSEANARLIAAAPELLEALESFASMNTQPEWPDNLNNAIIDARTAIAKARGEK